METIYAVIEKSIVEHNVDINSPYRLEAEFLIDKVFDKMISNNIIPTKSNCQTLTEVVISMFGNIK